MDSAGLDARIIAVALTASALQRLLVQVTRRTKEMKMASSQVMRVALTVGSAGSRGASVFMQDVGQGMVHVARNTFALLGVVAASVAIFAAGRADIRHEAEVQALGWLQARQEARTEPVQPVAPVALAVRPTAIVTTPAVVPPMITTESSAPEAVARATASDLKELSRPQAAVAIWLARRYKVAPEPVGALVKEAWRAGNKAGLDPTLILAIMAVESSFNPFAQSAVGAQGLMQVMTKVHNAKYEAFGGNHAAFDPVTNLRVGVQVLKECIAHAGSLEAGLRFYVGSGNQVEDGGYAGKVLSEQNSLRMVVGGKAPPARAPAPIVVAPVRAEAATVAEPKVDDAHSRPEEIALLHSVSAN